MVCISNRKETLLSLEEQTKSRLSPVVIPFQPYKPSELEEILLQRARDALGPDTRDKSVLTQLAQRARGDARVAIQGLRQAALAVESAGSGKVTGNVLRKVLPDSRETRKEELLSRLPYHQRLIYELAHKNAPITTTELRRIYTTCCDVKGI